MRLIIWFNLSQDNRDKLIKRTVITLLPKLAAANPESFVNHYRHTCINHLLTVLRRGDGDRPTAFIAVGEMALVSTDFIQVKFVLHLLSSFVLR
jgi:hypothetical protein